MSAIGVGRRPATQRGIEYSLSAARPSRIIPRMTIEPAHFGLLAAAYAVGSIPFAFLIARLRGVDIRKVGSGNVGATNVFRSVSKPLGLLTFLLDTVKGFVPAYGLPLAAQAAGLPAPAWLGLAGGAAAIAGHTWPVWLRFRGGKGVATGAGVLLAVSPWSVALALAVWLLVFALSRYVSLASIAAALVAAAAGWGFHRGERLRPVALTALAALIVVRHRSNIRRLISGDEARLSGRGRRSA